MPRRTGPVRIDAIYRMDLTMEMSQHDIESSASSALTLLLMSLSTRDHDIHSVLTISLHPYTLPTRLENVDKGWVLEICHIVESSTVSMFNGEVGFESRLTRFRTA